jgi:hypothetical protein
MEPLVVGSAASSKMVAQHQDWAVEESFLPHDRGLAHAKTCDKSPGIDGAKVAVDASDHEDDDAEDPEKTKKPRGHDTTDAIAHDKGTVFVQG